LFLRVRQPGTRLARRRVLSQRCFSLYIYGAPAKGPQIDSGGPSRSGRRESAVATSKDHQSTTYLRYVASPKYYVAPLMPKLHAGEKRPASKERMVRSHRSRSNIRVEADIDQQEALIKDMLRNPEKYQEQ
jgi:hypothetical protein